MRLVSRQLRYAKLDIKQNRKTRNVIPLPLKVTPKVCRMTPGAIHRVQTFGLKRSVSSRKWKISALVLLLRRKMGYVKLARRKRTFIICLMNRRVVIILLRLSLNDIMSTSRLLKVTELGLTLWWSELPLTPP